MRRLALLALVAGSLLVTSLTPRALSAQAGEAIAGGLAGVAAGTWWTLSITSARARNGDVLFTPSDVTRTAIVLGTIGAVAGTATGIWAEDDLAETMLGGAIGWAAGFGLGYVVGDALWDDPAGGWAGAVIGAGAGLAIGAVVGGLTAGGDDPLTADEPTAGITLGYSFRIGR